MKRILIGGDHVSIKLKKEVAAFLMKRGLEVLDVGTYAEDVIVDYNDYAQKVAKAVAAGEGDGGIVICGTGLGASIAANKVKGVRAALCHDVFTAHQARAHNDANVLAMGAWIVSPERMPGIVDEWLKTPFEGGRHIARVQALEQFIPDCPSKSESDYDMNVFQYAMALSTQETVFSPVLFAGKIEEGFAALHKSGFRQVELSLRYADDLPCDVLKALLDKYSLHVTALATGQGCLHDHLCLSATDPKLYSAAVKRLEEIINLAHQLDSAVILGGVRGRFSGSDAEQAAQRKNILGGVRKCCAYAQAKGVPVLLEAINHYETNCINTATQAIDFIEEVGSNNLKILLDTFHMNIEEVDVHTTLRMTGEHLGYLHLADSNRQAPGQGHSDLKSVLQTLFEIGYRGVVSAEILPVPDDSSAVQQTANFLRASGVQM